MNELVAQWHNRDESPDDFFLIRQYADGSMTAERKVAGVYSGEVPLILEQVRS